MAGRGRPGPSDDEREQIRSEKEEQAAAVESYAKEKTLSNGPVKNDRGSHLPAAYVIEHAGFKMVRVDH